MLFLLHLRVDINWRLSLAYRYLFMLCMLIFYWMGLSNCLCSNGLGFNFRSCLGLLQRFELFLRFMDGLLLVLFFRLLKISCLCSWLKILFINCDCWLMVMWKLQIEFFGCGSLRGRFIHDHFCVFEFMFLLMSCFLVLVVMFYGLWILIMSLFIGMLLSDFRRNLFSHDYCLDSDLICVLVVIILHDF